MSRELKFRAWDGGRMHYPEDWRNNDGVFMGMDGLPYQMDDDGACGDPDCCGPASYGMYKYHGAWEWMQATGLQDKHGKDIYESDIISGMRHMTVGSKITVVFDQDQAQFVGINSTGEIYWLSGEAKDIEVIGNKFQNPDLLEG